MYNEENNTSDPEMINKEADPTEEMKETTVSAEGEASAENKTVEESKDKLEAEVERLNNELKSLNDKFLRKVAEFDNYKRRSEQEQANLLKYSSEGFIAKVLPVIDDLERSLRFTKETDSAASVREGVQMIFDKFIKILNEQGIKKIESIGNHFDVHLHEAVMMMPNPDVEPLTIIEEIESGYFFKDKVLRHSKVIVAMASEETETSGNNGESKE